MSDALIEPRREKGEPHIAPAGLLVINPAEARYALNTARAQGGRKHYLFNSNLLLVGEGGSGSACFVAGPSVGAPMAVLTLEKLVALGARRLIVYGWCGSLNPRLRAGDILLPTWGISEEGTSKQYPLAAKAGSSHGLRETLAEQLFRQEYAVVQGPIWTTDAPYRETRDKVAEFAAQGAMGVDMEFSALCTVAAYRGIELAAVFLVSDELWHTEWQPGFRNKDFKKKSRRLVDQLIDAVKTYD